MNEKHTEAFTFMPVEVLVVHLMGPADRTYIIAVCFAEPFEPLVNDHIVHQEISKTICHDAKTDRLHPPYIIKCAEIDQQYTWYCEDDKECIILFKKTRLYLVMIFMQIPEKSMHDITMSEPCNTFHTNECCNQNKYIVKPGHNYFTSIVESAYRFFHHSSIFGKAR